MGLMLPRPSRRMHGIEWGATTPTQYVLDKVTITTVTANVKTGWSELSASCPYHSYGFSIGVSNTAASATARRVLLDIGVGAAGSEVAILSNFPCGGGSIQYISSKYTKFFPLFIPKGARVSCRIQGAQTAVAAHVGITFHSSDNGSSPFPMFQQADVLGVSTATSNSTDVSMGTQGAVSAWASFGSPTTRFYDALDCYVQLASADSAITGLVYFDVGIASTLFGSWLFTTDGAEVISGAHPDLPILRHIPSGSQLQYRSTPATSVSDSFGLAFIGYR